MFFKGLQSIVFRSFLPAMCGLFCCFLGCKDDTTYDELKARVERLEGAQASLSRKVDQLPLVPKPSSPISDSFLKLTGSEKDDPFLGNPNGSVLVMAFFDFESQSSRKFAKSTLSSLKEEFTPTSPVKFILRDFPLAHHPLALTAAQFAHCAGEQGKYWAAFDLLNKESALEAGQFSTPPVGVNGDKLRKCISSRRYEIEIERDTADAKALGAQGVPSFFIGNCEEDGCRGKFIRGAQPFGLLRKLIGEMS